MKTTENNFQIPEYTEKADIPGMVRGNIENAEKILKNIDDSLSSLANNVSSFSTSISSMQALLGTLSDELDAVNGAEG